MLIKFLFILTTFNESGFGDKQIQDFGLTAEDCTQTMIDYAAGNPDFTEGVPSCEFDGFTYLAAVKR